LSTNFVNQTPYLRTTRAFPEEVKQLAVEVNRAYVDIANAVNTRTISIYPTTRAAITGNNYYLVKNQRQQSFRQIYNFTTVPVDIPHGINLDEIYAVVKIYGAFTDGTFWYTLPWVSVVDVTNQINVFLSSSQIRITGGGGPGQPIPTQGTVVLEWVVNP